MRKRKREKTELDPVLKQPVIETVQKAEKVAEQLKDFAQCNGHKQLPLAPKQSEQFAPSNQVTQP